MKRFSKHLLKSGKASHAEKIIYYTLFNLQKQAQDQDAMHIVNKAVENSQPLFSLKKRKVGGRARQVPSLLKGKKRENIAVKWLIEAAAQKQNTSKKSLSFSDCLSSEIIDAYKNEGQVMKKKNELHKTAEANRGFVKSLW
jgi:small subunit ribosomal protein S7